MKFMEWVGFTTNAHSSADRVRKSTRLETKWYHRDNYR